MTRVLAIACALILAFVGPVVAQETPSASGERRIFVDGDVFADSDRDFTATYTRTPGFGVSGGVLLSRRTSVRVEIEVPAWHRRTWDRHLDYRHPDLGFIVNGPVITQTSTRTIVYTGLFGIEQNVGTRLRLAFLMGLGGAHRSDGITNSLPGTERVIGANTYSESTAAIHFGVDVQIAMTSRLALVPQFRAHSRFALPYFDEMRVRPGVALRWWL